MQKFARVCKMIEILSLVRVIYKRYYATNEVTIFNLSLNFKLRIHK